MSVKKRDGSELEAGAGWMEPTTTGLRWWLRRTMTEWGAVEELCLVWRDEGQGLGKDGTCRTASRGFSAYSLF